MALFYQQIPAAVTGGLGVGDVQSLDPVDMRGKKVVVVGMGNSGLDIASELGQRYLADKLIGRLLRQLERRVPALVARVLRPFSKPLADAVAGAASGGLGLLDQAIRGELQADASDDAFADDWDEYMVSP